MLKGVLLGLGCVFLGGCSDACANTIVLRLPSPDGRFEAVLFQRDCGATTDFSTQISIMEAGRRVGGNAGTVFRADGDHGAARAGKWGGPWAELKWLASDELQIRYASGSRLFERKERDQGVRISYQSVP